MKKVRIALAAVSVTVLLASCSMVSDPKLAAYEGLTPTCEKYVGGSEIDSVKVDAPEGKVPTVSFVTTDETNKTESNLAKIKNTQTKVVREGSGPMFTGDQLVTLEYAVYSSTSGKLLGSSSFDGTNPASQVFDSKNSKVYCQAMSGTKEGSVLAIATPKNDQDPEGSLYIFELKRVYLPKANGPVLAPVSGLPQVVRDPKSGRPGLVAPSFDKPTDFKSAVVIEGKGEVVSAGDSVTVHYSGWMWLDNLGGTFESSWDSQPATFSLNQTISGFAKALDGVKVGSQVVAVMPPDFAYGPGGNGTIPGNTTLVFVIDVLGINK